MRNELPSGLFGNRYRAVRELGRGGFAAVYEAWDEVAHRPVALKLVDPRALELAGGMHRFHREASVLQHLAHPNIVRAYDAGEHHGSPYLVLELLDGVTLEVALRDHGPMHPARVVAMARGLLGALADAHRAGVVHRDVKPANVFLCSIGGAEVVKLLDFGVAKADGMDVAKTAMGATLGTAAYMAPEQVNATAVGPPADLFAVGLLVAEALCGERVYGGGSGLAILVAKASGRTVELPLAIRSSPFAAFVARAVQIEPEHRFQSADAMRDALDAVARGIGIHIEASVRPQADMLGATTPIAALKRAAGIDSASGTWRPAEIAEAALAGGPTAVSPSNPPIGSGPIDSMEAFAETATHAPLAESHPPHPPHAPHAPHAPSSPPNMSAQVPVRVSHAPLPPARTSFTSTPPGSDPGEKVEPGAETQRAPTPRRRTWWMVAAIAVVLGAGGSVAVALGVGRDDPPVITIEPGGVFRIHDGDYDVLLPPTPAPAVPARDCPRLERSSDAEIMKSLGMLGLRVKTAGPMVTQWVAARAPEVVAVRVYRVLPLRVRPRVERDRVFAEMTKRLAVAGPTFASTTRVLVVPGAAGVSVDELEKALCK